MFILILLSTGGSLTYSHAQSISGQLDSLRICRFAALSNSMDMQLNENEGLHRYRLRAGFSFSTSVKRGFEFKGLGAIQYHSEGSSFSIQSLELIHSISAKWKWKIGNLVTPTTLGRPFPLSIYSMQETNAQAQIIGSRPGLGLSYSPGKALKIYTSIQHHPGNNAALHLGISYNLFHFSAFWERDGDYFLSSAYLSDHFRINFNYRKSLDAFNTSIIWMPNRRVEVFVDQGFYGGESESAFSEAGMRYYLKDKATSRSNGSITLGYRFSHRVFSMGLIVGLSDKKSV